MNLTENTREKFTKLTSGVFSQTEDNPFLVKSVDYSS